MNDFFKIGNINEFASNVCFGDGISLETNQKVLSFFKFLKNKNLCEIVGLVPTYNTLGVYWDHLADFDFNSRLKNLWEEFQTSENQRNAIDSRIFEFRVDYSGEDIFTLAQKLKLSLKEIIDLHSKPIYLVAMIGFLPGFPYLIGLDERLSVPRKPTPALKVKKGSVAIGGSQTGIYPQESPGGWHIIGYINEDLFLPEASQKSLLKPGDKVRFIPV